MTPTLRSRSFAATLGLAAVVLAPGISHAQDAQQDWRIGATIYGYLPSIGGTTRFPAPSGGGIDVSLDQLLDNLDFAFMGTLEAHNGRWGAFTDLMYLNIGADKKRNRDFTIGGTPIPAGTTADLKLDVKGSIWTLAGEYRLAAEPALTVDMLAGTRLIDLKQTLDWNITGNLGTLPPATRTGSAEAKVSNWDLIAGIKGRYTIDPARKWSLPFYADVGTGDSDLTWQVAAGVSYAFGWGELSALYRYLDYEMKSGRPVEDINFSGLMLGATFRW